MKKAIILILVIFISNHIYSQENMIDTTEIIITPVRFGTQASNFVFHKNYIDSLIKTETYKNRKVLPNELPDEFNITMNITGGCIGAIYNNIIIRYNAKQNLDTGYIITRNCFSNTEKTKYYNNTIRLAYFDTNFVNNVVDKLNEGIYWDTLNNFSPILRDDFPYSTGTSSGEFNLFFSYSDNNYKQIIKGGPAYTSGYFIELFDWLNDTVYKFVYKPTIDDINYFEKFTGTNKEQQNDLATIAYDYFEHINDYNENIEIFKDTTLNYHIRLPAFSHLNKYNGIDSIAWNIVDYMLNIYPFESQEKQYHFSYPNNYFKYLIRNSNPENLCMYLKQLESIENTYFNLILNEKLKKYCKE
ncbi:MAG: hypothetical protein K8R54_14870 [Bacteroidales bacterium]|nr:hypothetical protein [Bacteroidales bacterium]